MVKTKIICTLGPASSRSEILVKLMEAGMDVARLNFSHGELSWHKRCLDLIRRAGAQTRRKVKIMQDLEGLRIRVGKFKNSKGVNLKKGQTVYLTNEDITGNSRLVPFDYEGKLTDIKAGSHIFIDDGYICLLAKSTSKKYIKAEVVTGGLLKDNKGVNLPDVNLKFKGITEKDKLDIEFAIKNRLDYIAQSFVRNKSDILMLKELVSPRLPGCRIVAKIENRQGIKNIDEIINVSDGIMIARGDMGISVPIYEIPMIQKMIIKKCRKKRKFVITATQMLKSMTENLRPTRAEVTDVANAVLDGSSFVMLSEETAVGKYPVETTRLMQRIIDFTEHSKTK